MSVKNVGTNACENGTWQQALMLGHDHFGLGPRQGAAGRNFNGLLTILLLYRLFNSIMLYYNTDCLIINK